VAYAHCVVCVIAGISADNVFGFWDWVGGKHFFEAPMRQNLPVLLGMLGLWNSTFLGHETRAILPYAQALLRFPAHIQQVRPILSTQPNPTVMISRN
jgi:glucose-6-phosphate isomerase